MAVVLPQGKQQFFDANGDPAVGWKLYTYVPLTSTPKDTYTTYVGNVANTNPVVMDARGEAAIYWVGDYDVTLKTAADVTVWGPERLANVQDSLTSTSSATAGAGQVGHNRTLSYATGTVGNALNNRAVCVTDYPWSADSTGVSDSYAAFAAAIAYVGAHGKIIVPRGTYLLSNVITFDNPNVTLQGDGGSGDHLVTFTGITNLIATHSLGPVIRVKNIGCTVRDLVLGSSSGRYAGAVGSNYGLWIEAEDSASGDPNCRRTLIENIRITQQPNTGLVMIGNIVSSRLDFVNVDNSDGHGFMINGGNYTSRVNKARPGQLQINNCRASRMGGNALVLGGLPATEDNSLDTPYRVQVDNFECFYVGLDPAVALVQYCCISYGEQNTFDTCAWGGRQPDLTDLNGGVYVTGKSQKFLNNRYVVCAPYIAYVDNNPIQTTEDIEFNGGYIQNTNHGPGYYAPAIFVVSSACQNVRAEINTTSNDVTSLLAFTGTYSESKFKSEHRFEGADISSTYRSYANVLTLDDDKAAYITFSAATARGVITISGNTSSAKSAVVHFRVGDGSNHATLLTGTYGGTVTCTTGTLAGTTGTDTHLTIAADSATNRLYIENRTGGQRGYSVHIASMPGDFLLIGITNLA